MTIYDVPEEIAAAIYSQAYVQGFHDGQTTPPASRQAIVAKRQKAYKAWLVKLGVEQQTSRRRVVNPLFPHATVVR